MDDFAEFLATGVAAILAVIVVVLLWTLPTYWLWNWLMPEIFGLKAITLGQALGITFLSSILFKSPMYSSPTK